MENSVYASLNRQTGLFREMSAIANNLANMSTAGFRREGTVFSEYVRGLGADTPSLSMANAIGRFTNYFQGTMESTGGTLDFAIQGAGFFVLQDEGGQYLTRSGAFRTSPEGSLLDASGRQVLDAGGAPIQIPIQTVDLTVGADGTIEADGRPISQIGVWTVASEEDISRVDGVAFRLTGDAQPAEGGFEVFQGFLEAANVDPVVEIARMIEVQRAYELGQNFLEKEDERIRAALRALGSR